MLALALYNRENGTLDSAVHYAQKLVDLAPATSGFHRLLAELRDSRR